MSMSFSLSFSFGFPLCGEFAYTLNLEVTPSWGNSDGNCFGRGTSFTTSLEEGDLFSAQDGSVLALVSTV